MTLLWNELLEMLEQNGLTNIFESKKDDDHSDEDTPWVAYRTKSNIYRIRSLELWKAQKPFFRIYHSVRIEPAFYDQLKKMPGFLSAKQQLIDYDATHINSLLPQLKQLLLREDIIEECKKTSRFAKTSRFSGLALPEDIDFNVEDILGRSFTWREVIAIYEDTEGAQLLKDVLSQKGVYLQRSKDGASRYVGSAYSSGGFIQRWINHLLSTGDAHHLNLYILEHGYEDIEFTILEIIEDNDSTIIQAENRWKQTLGTRNIGMYNGVQLNNN